MPSSHLTLQCPHLTSPSSGSPHHKFPHPIRYKVNFPKGQFRPLFDIVRCGDYTFPKSAGVSELFDACLTSYLKPYLTPHLVPHLTPHLVA